MNEIDVPLSEAEQEMRKRKREEYEVQLFGFHSRDVYTTLKHLILHHISKICKKFHETLSNNLPSEKLPELEESMKTLAKLYRSSVRQTLPNVEKLVNDTFYIPDDVLLEEDADQAEQYTEEEYQALENELIDLQMRAKRAIILKAALEEEEAILDEVEEMAELAEKWCTVANEILKVPKNNLDLEQLSQEHKSLKNSMKEAVSNTPKNVYNPNVGTLKEINF